jgi:nicotinamidase-related amidase
MTQTYATDRTALLIVDPSNDLMSEGAKVDNAIKPTADASGIFANLRKLIPTIRKLGTQVFIVPHHRACDNDHHRWQHINMFIQKGEPLPAFEGRNMGRRDQSSRFPKEVHDLAK